MNFAIRRSGTYNESKEQIKDRLSAFEDEMEMSSVAESSEGNSRSKLPLPDMQSRNITKV